MISYYPLRFIMLLASLWIITAASGAVHAAPRLQILYSEPLVLLDSPDSTAGNRAVAGETGSQTMVFEAYGRHFNLQLKDNDLLNQQRSSTDYRLLKGTVNRIPGSWARLMHRRGEISGVFSDGEDIYVVETTQSVTGALVNPDSKPESKTGSGSIIYRLQDTLIETGTASCAARSGAGGVINGKTAFAQLTAELSNIQSANALGAVKRLSLGVVADFEFSSQYGPASESQILSRVNVVDGIFSAQVGVEIHVDNNDIVIFTNSNDPFTAIAAEDLLDEVSTYRQANQTQTGLTHLLTHRELQGVTVGIAWIDSLCDAHFGTGLSQTLGSTQMESALIMAHEIGHNFGADHDGEQGTSCESVQGNFLMSTDVTSNPTFSQCSLDDIAPTVARAVCITTIAATKIALSGIPPLLAATVDTEFVFPFSVVNNGISTATGVTILITVDPALEILDATASNGSCSPSGNIVDCQLSAIEPNGSRPVMVRLLGSTPGSQLPVSIVVSANLDGQVSSDTKTLTVTINPVQDQGSNTPAPGGGGGGGGTIDLLLLLLCMAAVRPRARARYGRQLH